MGDTRRCCSCSTNGGCVTATKRGVRMADRRAQLDGGGTAVTASTPLLAHGSNPINGTSDGGTGVDAGVDGVGDSGAAGVGSRAAGRRRQSAVSKAASRQSGGSVGRKSVPRRRASKKGACIHLSRLRWPQWLCQHSDAGSHDTLPARAGC